MSVPAHVRMDLHPFDEGLEKWAGKHIRNEQELRKYAPETSMPSMSLMDSIDGRAPVTRDNSGRWLIKCFRASLEPLLLTLHNT
jgi:hypothetical protein